MIRVLLVALLGGLLTGCQTTGPIDDSAFASTIPRGSSLILKRDLEINPGASRVTVQEGEIVGRGDARIPSCQLRTRELSPKDMPLIIKADTFIIGTPSRYYVQAPVMVAAEAAAQAYDDIVFRTIIPLSSPRQPDVNTMYCDIRGDRRRRGHLTIAEIRGAFGDILELQLLSN